MNPSDIGIMCSASSSGNESDHVPPEPATIECMNEATVRVVVPAFQPVFSFQRTQQFVTPDCRRRNEHADVAFLSCRSSSGVQRRRLKPPEPRTPCVWQGCPNLPSAAGPVSRLIVRFVKQSLLSTHTTIAAPYCHTSSCLRCSAMLLVERWPLVSAGELFAPIRLASTAHRRTPHQRANPCADTLLQPSKPPPVAVTCCSGYEEKFAATRSIREVAADAGAA